MLLMILNVQSKLYPQNFYLHHFLPNMSSVMNIRFHFVTRCHELEDSSRTLTLVTEWFSMSRCLNSTRTYCHEVIFPQRNPKRFYLKTILLWMILTRLNLIRMQNLNYWIHGKINFSNKSIFLLTPMRNKKKCNLLGKKGSPKGTVL